MKKKFSQKKNFKKKISKLFFLGIPLSKHVATLAVVVKCAPLEFIFRPTGQKADTMATHG